MALTKTQLNDLLGKALTNQIKALESSENPDPEYSKTLKKQLNEVQKKTSKNKEEYS